ELALEGTGRPGEFLGVDVQPHEHVMAGQPAPRDDLRHRTSPFSIVSRRNNIADPAKFHEGATALADVAATGVARGRMGVRYRRMEAISVMSFLRMASPKVS